ncbi:DUF1489 family protein [Microvirga antarctica]|uniref:DUF1489 family protein n=1 Tax=Microvirga antarctica TaxID=2819233 RepID=UPI001B303724|nr:DUF1489 domain-containing protein [Microvirga antarctica]
MSLHLIKLCVGCDSIADLEGWIEENRAHHARLGRPFDQTHTTRMMPKRGDELLDGGSLFWVIRGQVACRQGLLAITPFTDAGGIGRCRLSLDQTIVPVEPRPYRPFQGWRYLTATDAPRDLDMSAGDLSKMPEDMRRELAEMGLL